MSHAVGGAVIADLDARKATVVAAFEPDIDNVVVLWIGTNDLGAGMSAVDAHTALVALVDWYRANGASQIAVATVLPRSFSPDVAGFEARRTAFNGLLHGDAAGADAVVDVAADPAIGDAGDEFDTTYYMDQDGQAGAATYRVHLTATGRAVAGGVFRGWLVTAGAV